MPEVRLITPITRQEEKKMQVAAYCRVSSNSADQLNSYAAQIRAYKKLIGTHEEWELVDIFADATDIIGLKQNPTNGRRFSPIFSFIGHFRHKLTKCYFKGKGGKLNMARTRRSLISASQ